MRSPSVRRRPPTGWVVGVVAFAVLAYVLLNTLRTQSSGSAGPRIGAQMPPFAAPLAISGLEGDVNVARRPGQGEAGARPACEVRGPDVVNSCELASRGPVLVVFFATRGASCTAELDVIDRVLRRHRGIRAAGVAIRGDREALRRLVRSHAWSFPVAYDRDGILANLYGVAVCPHVTLAARGGQVRTTLLGRTGARTLDERLTLLEQGRL